MAVIPAFAGMTAFGSISINVGVRLCLTPSLRGYYWRTGEMTLLDCVTFTAVLSMVMSRGW